MSSCKCSWLSHDISCALALAENNYQVRGNSRNYDVVNENFVMGQLEYELLQVLENRMQPYSGTNTVPGFEHCLTKLLSLNNQFAITCKNGEHHEQCCHHNIMASCFQQVYLAGKASTSEYSDTKNITHYVAP